MLKALSCAIVQMFLRLAVEHGDLQEQTVVEHT